MKLKKISSLALLAVIGYIALQIPFTRLLGSNVKFTAFDFFAPTVGGFIGTLPGVITILTIQVINLFLHGTKWDIGGVVRLFPILFAVFYFSKKRSVNFAIPILAIIIFNLHPVGRSAWQFSLFWLIPIVANFFHKNLFLRSLGATFTAHSVGGALWVWVFGLSKVIWLGLIPVVAIERFAMACGMTLSYFMVQKVLQLVSTKTHSFALQKSK